MTSWSSGVHKQNERVIVAIDFNFDHLLCVTGGLAFLPQLLARAGPKPRLTSFESQRQAFAVHIGEGKHLPGMHILNNRRNQSSVVKLYLCEVHLHTVASAVRTNT